MHIAQSVASWSFAVTVLCLIAAWVVWNIVDKPFQPYPVTIFAVTSAVLATVGSLQGPLILLTQRRAADHARGRDEEALRVVINAESDLHRIEAKIDAVAAGLEALGP